MNNMKKTMVYHLYYEGYPIWKIAKILDITEAEVVRILGR